MKKFLTLGLLLVMTYCLNGQNSTDTIETRKALGVIFLQNGKKLTTRDLLEVFSSNAESYKEMKIAKINNDVGSVVGSVGGFMVGWTLGTAMGGGEPNWTVAAAGVGLIAISIPFSTAYSKHARKAVETYNNGLKESGHIAVEYTLGLTPGGIGLKINF